MCVLCGRTCPKAPQETLPGCIFVTGMLFQNTHENNLRVNYLKKNQNAPRPSEHYFVVRGALHKVTFFFSSFVLYTCLFFRRESERTIIKNVQGLNPAIIMGVPVGRFPHTGELLLLVHAKGCLGTDFLHLGKAFCKKGIGVNESAVGGRL